MTTVLVLSWDEGHLLRHSLPRICAQDGAEVVVIDDACSDDTAAVADEHGAAVVRLDERVSSAALNRGLAVAGTGTDVLLLNADYFVEPGFLAAATARLREPGVGSVAPRLVRALGPAPEQRLDALDAAGMTVDRRRKNGLVGHGRPALAHDLAGECFGADGAAVLYRRETLDQCTVHGEVLDEDMERWASDVDLAWRARTLGWKCGYEPAAVAYHVRSYSPSTRAGMPARDRRMQFRNRYLMIAKNDRPGALLRDAPALAAYELGALGYALAVERELLGGYREAARLLPGALRRRRALHAARSAAGHPSVPFGLKAPA
ncbi:MAG: glycosyltransferase family 2 protein [Thermoleophilaceae bacterium]